MKIAIILGSESDRDLAQKGLDVFEKAGVNYEIVVHSAHRDLDGLLEYIHSAKDIDVVIAIAGMSAALPGIIASNVDIPVIGVPREVGIFHGVDALLSMIQMPTGVPLATMSIGETGMINAALLVLRILKLAQKETKGEKTSRL